MKQGKIMLYAWFLITMGFLLWARKIETSVQAQTVTSAPFTIQAAGPSTSCPAPQTGLTLYCFATDGLMASINGAKYVAVPLSAPLAAVTINGKTGTSFTIGATSTAPVITANSTTPTVTVSVN